MHVKNSLALTEFYAYPTKVLESLKYPWKSIVVKNPLASA